ncbi:DUF1837 domain-containing protein [Cytophagaceae bacterium YF14B1]|uniref:DUF1837 domain-containing protein n=1 Tax=Xanthocytophaga flava TaxID=3048013 RepID=A0AAE3QXJ6_9BACT|nr:DUF1837 domain-containing protein [Xanthocytophaga flavus]MDJ1484328.1 DUF1837 domain-containing protein [Xanthocytophaga flavus]
MNFKFLNLIVYQKQQLNSLVGLCGGYELNEWRYKQFAEWLFDYHLLDFALKYSEYKDIDFTTAAKKLRTAARIIFQTENPRRGEFGELLLHGVIKEAFNTTPAITKIYFKDGPNETVKGFDAVHVVANDNNLELWLGEVKFYNDFHTAVSHVVTEIQDHLQKDYLRNEFLAINNKLDNTFPHYEKLRKLLDTNTSLDQIFDAICIPVLLTYDSTIVKKHNKLSEQYTTELREELIAYDLHFWKKLGSCQVKVHLFLVPLEDKAKLFETLLEKLKLWQNI